VEIFTLFFKTILFRPYVFAFLAAFLFAAIKLIGWPRTWRFWLISWITAFVCEFSSTRTGIPFGWYHYNGSTLGQELYFFDVPFMDSIEVFIEVIASRTCVRMEPCEVVIRLDAAEIPSIAEVIRSSAEVVRSISTLGSVIAYAQ
jgi:putative membrane protein